MHFAISTTWGPTDTTRASLPFIFAKQALAKGDTVMLMLFHDAVSIAVEGTSAKMLPVGPPPAFDEVFAHENAEVIVCDPCAAARGITADMLRENARLGGMGDLHAQATREDCRPIAF
jgi:tRNA 2-thiouridine synthesizing protein D